MKIDSYMGQTGPTLCVLVPNGVQPLDVMSANDKALFTGPFKLFKSFELSSADNRIGIDVAKAIADITSVGYAIVRSTIQIGETAR